MDINREYLFIPKCLEKELKLIVDSSFNYTKISNAFFSHNKKYTNSIYNFKNLILKNKPKRLTNETINNQHIDNNDNKNQNCFSSIIIPNVSKESIIKLLRNFNSKSTNNNNLINEEDKRNMEYKECINQNESYNNTDTTYYRNSFMNIIYTNTISSIFGSSNEKTFNKHNQIITNIIKINNIDENCDYFHVDLTFTNANKSAFNRLKSNFLRFSKTYDLFLYVYDKYSNSNNISFKKKNLDFNDNEDLQLFSNNNDDTTDDCNLIQMRQISNSNLYHSKNPLVKEKNIQINSPEFSIIFFKFINKINSKNYFDFKIPFTYYNSSNSEEEFIVVISILEVNNEFSKNKRNSENSYCNEKKKTVILNDQNNSSNESNGKNKNVSYTKINFNILSKENLNKLDILKNNIFEQEKFLEEVEIENLKNSFFVELIDYFKNMIISKISNLNNNLIISEEDEERILEIMLSYENNNPILSDLSNPPNSKNILFSSNNKDRLKIDLINININTKINLKDSDDYLFNRNNLCEKSLIDYEELNFDWMSDFNEELNADLKFKDDKEYLNLKIMQENDLKKLNYHGNYLELIKQLRQILKEDPYKVFGENELIRHIYGWRGELDGCRDSLIAMLKWRNTAKPETYNFNKDFAIYPNIDFKNLLQVVCKDIYGRPIIKFSPSFLNPKIISIELLTKYLVYILEIACSQMSKYMDKYLLFVDMGNVGYSNVSTDHLNTINQFTRKYYVERLIKIYLINKGFLFSMLWAIVSKFLDERVTKKLTVVDKSHKGHLQYLLGDNYSLLGINL